MATNASPTSARTLADPPVPPLEEASALTCIQPGGGVCFALETAWGGVRRAWLRAARPSYVRRMAERRQGSCEACSHDVVDARDLKQLRNACGYFFREEDDPFRWREKLRLARVGLAEVVVSSFVCAAVLIPVVATALARRLVCALKVGEEVRAGNRFGMIKYGSRTDVLIPVGENVERVAKVGDRLLAGTSILLRFGKR